MKIRSFLAFDIPSKVTSKLAKLINDFSQKERSVKWVAPDKLHVTMKFFGDVEEPLLLDQVSAKIFDAVKGFGSIKLTCEGIGVFPNWKYPRVIWAGFYGETDRIMDLHDKLEGSLSTFNFKKDLRAFRVHLTLGRTNGVLKNSPLVTLVEKLGPIKFGEVAVDKLVLYKSVLTKTGSIYTPLKEFIL